MPVRALPRLHRIDARADSHGARQKVVLVHGMASSSDGAFRNLRINLEKLDVARQFDLWGFDYDTNQSFSDSADQLVNALRRQELGDCSIHFIGHSMGGLVARMAVLRHNLPNVQRLITLATPNHGAINGTQLNFLGQLIALATRHISPIYVRKQGVIDLISAHKIMKDALDKMEVQDPRRLDGKSYASIPAQYYHTKRQFGDPSPSMLMGGTTLSIAVLNKALKQRMIVLTPVHDGIVEERSNRLSPEPVGSTSEASYMPTLKDASERVLHVSHEAAADYDHVTITSSREIADLIRAVLIARRLCEADICAAITGKPTQVKIRPQVS